MNNERWVVRYMNGVDRWMYVTPNNGVPTSDPEQAWSAVHESQAEAEARRFKQAHPLMVAYQTAQAYCMPRVTSDPQEIARELYRRRGEDEIEQARRLR